MATFDSFRTASTAAPLGGVFSVFAHIAGALREWNDTRATRKALSRLSAHELDDIGLNPGDIDRIG